ncbi:MAG: HAMP domain-containing sensor histidine kinase [Oscillospiraceae bacterium]
MKSFYRWAVAVAAVFVLLALSANLALSGVFTKDSGRAYRVEINRAVKALAQNGLDGVDLSAYDCITAIVPKGNAGDEFYAGGSQDYVIRQAGGETYRIEYEAQGGGAQKRARLVLNFALGGAFAVTGALLLFARAKLLKPFDRLRNVPYELSKGNLTVPLKEGKSRFFGRFVWGMDLLRENLEETHVRELKLQKDKKTLVLSVSHDIKTPLSAIKLYAKALTHNLYADRARQTEIAQAIDGKADEIERFVAQIIQASGEDFTELSVNAGEFYLAALIARIDAFYAEKLALLHIRWRVGAWENCLLAGDLERAVEVLQNLIENAVKYGDGREIALRFTDEENCRLITVENTGVPLNANEMDHIFDLFWRGSNAGANAGNGLGLYICRQLMVKMNGGIFVRTTAETTCVTVVFPRA